jgi:hypothetical protein
MPVKQKERNRNASLIQKKHEGKWVAISSDYKKVLDYSDNVVELVNKNGRDNVVYMKALRSNISYAFFSRNGMEGI